MVYQISPEHSLHLSKLKQITAETSNGLFWDKCFFSFGVSSCISWGVGVAYVTVSYSNHRVSYIPSSWMVHTGCVFAAGIHLSRTWNVRIFWVRAMECMRVQTRPRFMLSSEGVRGGMESETMLTPTEKSPLLEAQRRFKPATLHHAGQRAQHTIDWAIPAPR